LSTLSRLTILNLASNNIDLIPEDVFVDGDSENFPALESLDLSVGICTLESS
jgi:Leucine-rich repeat (LRR) protein